MHAYVRTYNTTQMQCYTRVYLTYTRVILRVHRCCTLGPHEYQAIACTSVLTCLEVYPAIPNLSCAQVLEGLTALRDITTVVFLWHT